MQRAHPIIPRGTDAEIDDPELGSTRRAPQATPPLRVAEMTCMHLEPATFLIRKEGLDLRALWVVLHDRVQISEIRHEIDRFLERQRPDGQDADGAIRFGGHPRGRDGQEFTARWPQVADVDVDAIGAPE